MPHLFRTIAFAASALLLAGCASMGGDNSYKTAAEQANLANDAQATLLNQMSNPDSQRIPTQMLANARCVAVFPSVIKAGLIVGGQHGRGLVSCRQSGSGFAAANPAVYSLSGGSIGLQAGAKKSSIVLLFMTRQSVDQLMNSKIQFGTQITASAGPTGHNRPINKAPSPVLAYALYQNGLYAGLDLTGTKLSFDQDANDSLYGQYSTAPGVLLGSNKPSVSMDSYKQTLKKFVSSP